MWMFLYQDQGWLPLRESSTMGPDGLTLTVRVFGVRGGEYH